MEIARRLEGFKCTIGYADPVRRDVAYRQYPDWPVARPHNSDIVFLCAAGAPGRGHIVARAGVLYALGPRGIFVNVARGWLVDEAALPRRSSKAGSAPPPSTCSRTSRRSRKRCSSSTMSC